MISFPANCVWEWTDDTPDGRPMWSGRPITLADRQRRREMEDQFRERQLDREKRGIKWFQIGTVEDGLRRRG